MRTLSDHLGGTCQRGAPRLLPLVVVVVEVTLYFKATDPLFFSGMWEALSQMVCAGVAIVGTRAKRPGF